MPTTRTRRSRQWTPELDDYRRHELLAGPGSVLLAGRGYYAEWLQPLHEVDPPTEAAARAAMQVDWQKHGEALTAWWVFGHATPTVRPWTWIAAGGPGTRPWSWWQFTAPEPKAPDETEAAYLRRLSLFLPGEEERLPHAD